ncbi:MAG: serine/threonine protein kinase [Blastocatellia bacterium]|nr:serine/threonine protein kinase [Blastocatellia bacterium]
MDQERWDRIEDLLQYTLDLVPDERAAFLEKACAGDTELRREVESLLSNEAKARSFIESPALARWAGQMEEHPEASLIGRRIGHYSIESLIGAGGMGEVYKARDENLHRTIALKMLPAEFTSDAWRVRRFEQEARAASALNHPNIITIFEIIHDGGNHFIAAEYVEGETLREMLTRAAESRARRLGVEEAVDIAIQVAAALKAAHTAWIIHRDIKPENIMVRSDGLVKVLDFGIAKLSGATPEEESAAPPSDGSPLEQSLSPEGDDTSLTSPGMVLGTASYMSPEQARGEALDGRTDVFSLGVVLYEMVMGERLFGEATRAEMFETILGEREPLPPQARFDHTPKEMERMIRKALRRRREERYSSAGEMLDDLTALKRRLASRASRRIVKIAALAIILAVIFVMAAAALSVNEDWEERLLRDGHTAAALRAAFSPDGRLLVSCGEDKQVIVWDFARRERLKTLTGHADWVTSIAFSPDGRWLATSSLDQTAIVWDAERWEKVRVLDEHKAPVHAVAFSPDGRFLASGANSTILWDTRTWERVRELPLVIGYGPLLFSPDSRMVMTHGEQWDLTTGQKVGQVGGGNWKAFSPDARRMTIIGGGGEVIFLKLSRPGEIAGSKLIAELRGHQDHGRAIAFSPDGKLVASGAENILLWDATAMTKLGRFEYDSIVWGLVFSPDGRWLVSTHGDGAILIWNIAERRREASLDGHSDAVRAVAFSPDGKRFASAGEDRSVIVWDAEQGRKLAVLEAHQTRVMAVAFSPDGNWLGSADQDGMVILWDLMRRQPRLKIRHTGQAPAYCLAISPDGRWVATTQGVYRSDDGREVEDYLFNNRRFGNVYSAAFSADGRRLACVTDRGWALLWDAERWQLLEKLQVSNLAVSVSLSRDGKWLVTGGDEGVLQLCSVEPLREVAVLGQHAARVKSVAFSPDGATVASAGDDKMIALWDTNRRKLIARVGTHTSPVYAIAFSPDGQRLVSGEHDRSVRLYRRHRTLWGFRLD